MNVISPGSARRGVGSLFSRRPTRGGWRVCGLHSRVGYEKCESLPSPRCYRVHVHQSSSRARRINKFSIRGIRIPSPDSARRSFEPLSKTSCPPFPTLPAPPAAPLPKAVKWRGAFDRRKPRPDNHFMEILCHASTACRGTGFVPPGGRRREPRSGRTTPRTAAPGFARLSPRPRPDSRVTLDHARVLSASSHHTDAETGPSGLKEEVAP